MKIIRTCLTGAVKAAYFSEDTQNYFTNSRKAAFASFAVPLALLLFMGLMFCVFTGICIYTSFYWFFASYIASFIVLFMIAAPKFPIFFMLVWYLCQLFRQTDHFWAFMTATNWFYVIYALLFLCEITFYNFDIPVYTTWRLAQIFYFCLITFFLAHNVLRLPGEIAWLVPMASLFTHALVRVITTKQGALFVF